MLGYITFTATPLTKNTTIAKPETPEANGLTVILILLEPIFSPPFLYFSSPLAGEVRRGVMMFWKKVRKETRVSASFLETQFTLSRLLGRFSRALLSLPRILGARKNSCERWGSIDCPIPNGGKQVRRQLRPPGVVQLDSEQRGYALDDRLHSRNPIISELII